MCKENGSTTALHKTQKPANQQLITFYHNTVFTTRLTLALLYKNLKQLTLCLLPLSPSTIAWYC